MSRNSEAKPIWIANVAVPGGGNQLLLTADEAALYNADPDGFAGEEFWVD